MWSSPSIDGAAYSQEWFDVYEELDIDRISIDSDSVTVETSNSVEWFRQDSFVGHF